MLEEAEFYNITAVINLVKDCIKNLDKTKQVWKVEQTKDKFVVVF